MTEASSVKNQKSFRKNAFKSFQQIILCLFSISVPCAAGSYFSSSQSACVLCAPGQYQDRSRQTGCITCQDGYHSPRGATSCTQSPTEEPVDFFVVIRPTLNQGGCQTLEYKLQHPLDLLAKLVLWQSLGLISQRLGIQIPAEVGNVSIFFKILLPTTIWQKNSVRKNVSNRTFMQRNSFHNF